jgi:hypothetical protein
MPVGVADRQFQSGGIRTANVSSGSVAGVALHAVAGSNPSQKLAIGAA